VAELKTKPTSVTARSFIKEVADEGRRSDCELLLALMKTLTGKKATMWGKAIVGFGSYHYRYNSGREGDWFVTGFSPRKRDLTIYIMPGFDNYPEIMARLGNYRLGKSCLYVKRLDDIDRGALGDLIQASLVDMARMYDCT
jgi:hypothetical protein